MHNLTFDSPEFREIVLSDFPEHSIIYHGTDRTFQLMYHRETGDIRLTTQSERQHIEEMISMLIDANQETDSDI